MHRLKKKTKPWRKSRRKSPLTAAQILAWADEFHERKGRWPQQGDGRISATLGDETWKAVDSALHVGCRGFPGGSSLARLLAEKRGKRNKSDLPRLSVRQILGWLDAHRRRTGRWPSHLSGVIPGANGETWSTVQHALQRGNRGLPRRSSLSKLLDEHRNVRNRKNLPRLSQRKIVNWAKAHRRRTGRWPGVGSGPVEDAKDESWMAIDVSLTQGLRGLPGGSSLARLLGRGRIGKTKRAHPR